METIIIIISTIITSLGILLCISNFYDKKIVISKKILFVILFTTIVFFVVEYTTNFTKLTLNYLSMLFLMNFLLIDRNIKKSIIYTTIIFLSSMLIEIILTLILKSIINFDELYNKYHLILLLFNLAVNFFLVLLSKTKFYKRIANRSNLSTIFLKIFLLLVIIICFLIAIQNRKIINTNSIAYLINILTFFFIMLIIYIFIDMNNKNNQISNQYNQMMEYMTEYEKIIDEQGKKNHEFNNQLMILNGYIDNKKKLKEYLNTIIDDHKTGQNYEIRQLSHFPNGGLKGLLYYKLTKMKENNIKYYLYVSKEISKVLEKLDIKNYKDISKIFGVLIDNAIDASMKSSQKQIIIDFKMDEKYLVITITNSVDEKIDVKKIGTGYSSKGRGHGFGLRLVNDIIRKNQNLELYTDYNENEFIQTLLIATK